MSVPFSFYNFSGLIDLQRGIAQRMGDTRLEAFSILFCDFTGLDKAKVEDSLNHVLRTSDSYVHYDGRYFFVLYQTDKYGATIVKDMFEEFFDTPVKSTSVCFPKDGESAQDLFDALQAQTKKSLDIDLECLDHDSHRRPKELI